MAFSDTIQTDFSEQISDVISTINGANRFLVISHVRPDGDAIGSVSGLVKSLRKAGKNVQVALADPAPERFAFVLDEDHIGKPGEIEIDHEVIFVLDAGDLARTGFDSDLEDTGAVLVNIDHHASNTIFGDVNFVDTAASSTCEMIVRLIHQAGLPLDADIATGLYLGLITDTRSFQNEGLKSTAHTIAALLLETGLDTAPILSKLNGSKTLPELKLLGKGLQNLRLEADGRLACIVLSRRDIEECGAAFNNVASCGLWGHLTSIQGVVAGVGVFEGFDGKTYCEFRSRGGFDVKEIAVAMGGGGHLAASGCNRDAPIQTVAAEALERLRAGLSAFDLRAKQGGDSSALP